MEKLTQSPNLNDSSIQDVLAGKICPYCNCKTELVSDKEIYGEGSTYGGKYYRCILNHDHYVGCYSFSTRAYGSIADKELRTLRH